MAAPTTGLPSKAALKMSVSYSPNWDKLLKRYKNVDGHEELVRTGLIKWAMKEGVKVAVSELDKVVYNLPTPQGSVRTGRARRAIMERPDTITGKKQDSGAIVVNRSRFTVYYPRFLEDGTAQMRARHYWRNTKVRMRAEFAHEGRKALRQYKMQLKVK